MKVIQVSQAVEKMMRHIGEVGVGAFDRIERRENLLQDRVLQLLRAKLQLHTHAHYACHDDTLGLAVHEFDAPVRQLAGATAMIEFHIDGT